MTSSSRLFGYSAAIAALALIGSISCSGTATTGLEPSADAGMIEPDAGNASADASDPVSDAGSVNDAGNAEQDSGMDVHDAGSPVDSGVRAFPGELTNWCRGQPENFSFFVTSMSGLWALAATPIDDLQGGFGGDFGGLAGADQICQTIAEATGFGHKTWHAFLSATNNGSGNAVNAIQRIGAGPWYDANGRLVATGISGLSANRPNGDAQSVADLPDECGVPLTALGDAHDVVTGSNSQGNLASTNLSNTCNDWTTSDGRVGGGSGGPGGGGVMCGHSFPRMGGGGRGGANWAGDHGLRGCGKGANLIQNGAGTGTCIGCSGGYGALYCFAL